SRTVDMERLLVFGPGIPAGRQSGRLCRDGRSRARFVPPDGRAHSRSRLAARSIPSRLIPDSMNTENKPHPNPFYLLAGAILSLALFLGVFKIGELVGFRKA